MKRIIKNQTNQIIHIRDLGITVPPFDSVNLLDLSSIDNLVLSNDLLLYLSNRKLVLNDGTNDLDAITAIRLISGLSQPLPYKNKEQKLWVQTTPRPVSTKDMTFYSVWSGAGDDFITETRTGPNGQLMMVEVTEEQDVASIDFGFFTASEPVYIHSGYFSWENAGWGDTVSLHVVAQATPVMENSSGNLIVNEYHKIQYVSDSTGTHSFAGTPVPVKNVSNTGLWNLDEETYQLTPANNNGKYDLYDIDVPVMAFLNKIPVFKTSYMPLRIVSYDSQELPPNYKLRIILHNNSKSNWKFWGFMSIFRLLTYP